MKQNELEISDIAKRGDLCLISWGAWAASGDRAAMPRVRSVLDQRKTGVVAVESVGECVDHVLAAMSADLVQLAMLMYRHRQQYSQVRAQLGIGRTALDARLLSLRVAVYMALLMIDKKIVDNTPA